MTVPENVKIRGQNLSPDCDIKMFHGTNTATLKSEMPSNGLS